MSVRARLLLAASWAGLKLAALIYAALLVRRELQGGAR